MKLYHYTNANAAGAIDRSRNILMSKGRDSYFGEGVYFTSLPPSVSKHYIIANNWDGKFPWEMIEKYETFHIIWKHKNMYQLAIANQWSLQGAYINKSLD